MLKWITLCFIFITFGIINMNCLIISLYKMYLVVALSKLLIVPLMCYVLFAIKSLFVSLQHCC